MYYIVQENLFNESGYGRLVQALNSLQLEHEFIKLIPFVDDIDVSTKRNDVFVFGYQDFTEFKNEKDLHLIHSKKTGCYVITKDFNGKKILF